MFRIGKDGDQSPTEEWLEARGDGGPVRAESSGDLTDRWRRIHVETAQ
jgi:hypothetical protein